MTGKEIRAKIELCTAEIKLAEASREEEVCFRYLVNSKKEAIQLITDEIYYLKQDLMDAKEREDGEEEHEDF